MVGTSSQSPAPLSRLGQLLDPEEECRFQAAKAPITRQRLRFICVITIPAYLAAIYADSLQLQGQALLHLAGARVAACAFGLLLLVVTFRKNATSALLNAATGLYMVALMATEVFELPLKAGLAPQPETPITVLMVLMFYLFLPPQIWQPLMAAGLGSVAYLLMLTLRVPISPGQLSNTAIIFIMANAFGAYFYIRFGAAQRREFLALTHLRHKAETDDLTGLLNRRRVMELGLREFNSAQRYGYSCSLLVLDIDHFKSVNDTYGHAVGDLVLADFALRCRDSLREADLFGRIGGEEFVIFMPHISLVQAVVAAERLRLAVASRPFTAGANGIDVTVSIGATQLSEQTPTLDKLLMKGDSALYRAKQEGRNRVCAAGDMAN